MQVLTALLRGLEVLFLGEGAGGYNHNAGTWHEQTSKYLVVVVVVVGARTRGSHRLKESQACDNRAFRTWVPQTRFLRDANRL